MFVPTLAGAERESIFLPPSHSKLATSRLASRSLAFTGSNPTRTDLISLWKDFRRIRWKISAKAHARVIARKIAFFFHLKATNVSGKFCPAVNVPADFSQLARFYVLESSADFSCFSFLNCPTMLRNFRGLNFISHNSLSYYLLLYKNQSADFHLFYSQIRHDFQRKYLSFFYRNESRCRINRRERYKTNITFLLVYSKIMPLACPQSFASRPNVLFSLDNVSTNGIILQ